MRHWAVQAAVIVAIEYLAALLIGVRVGFHYTIPFRGFATIGFAIAFVGCFVAFIVRLARLFFAGEPRPIRRLRGEAHHLSGFVVGCLLVTAQMAVLCWLKVMMPLTAGFWADPILANIDRAMFGIDPWRVTHMLGDLPFLDRLYLTWAPAKLATITVLVCLPESLRKSRALVAYFATWATGALGQYILPAAGPVFWQHLGIGDRFSSLPREPWVNVAAQYLWSDYLKGGGHIGTGISAMPSMHVALAAWVALVIQSYAPRLRYVAWAWVAAIFFASVHLGWHYAIDGIVAVAIALLAWRAPLSLRISRPKRSLERGIAWRGNRAGNS